MKPLSIEDVPKSEETRKLDRKEIYTLKRQLEQIPVASSEEFFTGEVTEFLKGMKITELESLEVVQDTLSSEYREKIKSRCTIIEVSMGSVL